ncbi:hypothetical protein KJ855_00885 [Patescibacteria group bacterium]|nr:hypothetical protein [Patescibacteria group bacterium]
MPACQKYQNPAKLFERQCQCAGLQSKNQVWYNKSSHSHGDNPCPNTFQTTYSPDRPETIYCQECYSKEVE